MRSLRHSFWALLCGVQLTTAVHATHGYWFSGVGTFMEVASRAKHVFYL